MVHTDAAIVTRRNQVYTQVKEESRMITASTARVLAEETKDRCTRQIKKNCKEVLDYISLRITERASEGETDLAFYWGNNVSQKAAIPILEYEMIDDCPDADDLYTLSGHIIQDALLDMGYVVSLSEGTLEINWSEAELPPDTEGWVE